MSWEEILKENPEDIVNTPEWKAKQDRLRAKMEQGRFVPDWGDKAIIIEEDKGHAKAVVGKVTNPNGKKVNVYSPNIVLASDWGN